MSLFIYLSPFFLCEMRSEVFSAPPDIKKSGVMSKVIVYALSAINIEVYLFQLCCIPNVNMW